MADKKTPEPKVEEAKEEKTDRILYPSNGKKHLFDDVVPPMPLQVNIDIPSQTVRNVFSILELDDRTVDLYNKLGAIEHQVKHIQDYIVQKEEERRITLIERIGFFFGKLYGKVKEPKQP